MFDIFYPRIIEIISKNETDIILSPALLPEVNELNQKFVIALEEMLKKYGLTKSTLMLDDPFLKSLTDFRSLLLKRLKPYPDFDYNLNSWEKKKQQIHHKLRLTELNLISKLGKDYQEYMKSFEASIIKKELVDLFTYFKLEETPKTK